MTNPMLADLDEVVRLKGYIKQSREHFDHAKSAALQFLINHHSTLADMAKRLEAAARDAARYRWLRDHNNVIGGDGITECPVEIFIHGESHAPGHLDAQVDAAIAATQEGEG